MTPLVLVDFDGTIVRQDVTDLILERFALPEWQAIERDWVAGRIGSRECLARQIDLVRATDRDLDDLIAEVEIDPAFPTFVALCAELGFRIVIASDGLDRVITAVLSRARLDLNYVSNRLVQVGADRWRLDFPHFDGACRASSGTCKCAISRPHAAPTILVGDGRSDFCVAAQARWVLAKGQLAGHCRRNSIAHLPIESLSDASDFLRMMLWRKAPARTSAGLSGNRAGASHA